MSEKRVHKPVKRYEGFVTDNMWTEDDKRMLLKGLNKYGHTDVQSLAKLLPKKSITVIKNMINSLMMSARRSAGPYKKPPIDMWLEQASLNETNALIPKALLFISIFERHPDPKDCNGFDFRAAYDYIYRMTCGHPTIELPTKTRQIIYKIISKTVSKMRLRSNENLVKFTNNLYKSAAGKDYSRNITPQKIGPYKVLHELNTFSVPCNQLRVSSKD